MTYTPLGRIRPVYAGGWSAARDYTVLEVVQSPDGRAAYMALKDVPAGVPVTNESYWAAVLDVREALKAAESAVDEAVQRADDAADRARAAASDSARPLALAETAQPAQIWPDEGSVLRPLVFMEPSQDGSGNPYPAGLGGQLFDAGAILSAGASVDAEGWITCEIDNTAGVSTGYVNAYTPASALLKPGGVYTVVCEVKEISGKLYAVNASTASSTGQFSSGLTVTGAGTHTAQLTARSDFSGCVTMLRTTFAVDAGSSGRCVFRLSVLEGAADTSGFAYRPYENIRPVKGRTAAEIVRCGRNLLNMASIVPGNSGVTVEHGENTVRVRTVSAAYADGRTAALVLRGGVKYTLSAKVSEIAAGAVRVGFRRAEGAKINSMISGASIRVSAPGESSVSFTLDEDVKAYFSAMVTWDTAGAGDATFADLQLEVGEATAFEPHAGGAFSRAFGRIVYGGSFDAASGLLTLDRAVRTYDGENFTWEASSVTTHDRFLNRIADAQPSSAVVCSHAHSDSALNDPGGAYVNQNGAFCWNFAPYGTVSAAEFKDYLAAQAAAGTPVQVCYRLAKPLTVQLTPMTISALAGMNSVFSDGDGLSVGYNKSLVREREELLAKIAAGGGEGMSADDLEDLSAMLN